MRIVVCGGHLTPALAFCEYLIKNGHEPIWFGRTGSREKAETQSLNIPFYSIPAVKLHRHQPLSIVASIPQFATSFYQSFKLLKQLKTDAAIGFGGYLSLPVILSAKLLKLKTIIHEQTTEIGLANQLLASYVDVIAVSHPNSLNFVPKNKSYVTGNLIRSSLYSSSPHKPSWVDNLEQKPLIYVTGGNQGSVFINNLIQELIPQLTTDYVLIHQTGPNYNSQTPTSSSYYYQSWFNQEEVSYLLQNSHIVISRSGANTVSEVSYFKTPAIFIPLPITQRNEQLKNTQPLLDKNLCLVLTQNKANKDSLINALKDLEFRYQQIKSDYSLYSPNLQDSPENLFRLLSL